MTPCAATVEAVTNGPVIASKVANALVEGAGASGPLGVLDPVLDQFRQQYGGVWVGGRLTLTPTTLEFHPNGVNRLANTGPLDLEIDLRRVESVEVQPGVLTKIIAVQVGGGRVVKARCFGAAGLADQVRAAVRSAQA